MLIKKRKKKKEKKKRQQHLICVPGKQHEFGGHVR